MSSNDLYNQFDGVFIEKSRLSIMTLLYQEKTVTFLRLKAILGATDGALYSHMKKLVEAGYVRREKRLAGERAETLYTLTTEGSSLFRRYLRFLENMLESAREEENDGR